MPDLCERDFAPAADRLAGRWAPRLAWSCGSGSGSGGFLMTTVAEDSSRDLESLFNLVDRGGIGPQDE